MCDYKCCNNCKNAYENPDCELLEVEDENEWDTANNYCSWYEEED